LPVTVTFCPGKSTWCDVTPTVSNQIS
jgi:hypothetical protein